MPSFVIPSFKAYLDGLAWKQVPDFRGIVIHHSATPDYKTGYSWAAIKKFHTDPKPEGNGWRDIGYHFGLEQAENYVPFLAGRSMYEFGAHALNYNEGAHATIGICCVGNYDLAPPEPSVWNRLVFMCQELNRQFETRRGVKLNNLILGHRETYAPKPAQKSCPGSQFDLYEFRKCVLR